jgi:glycosyltransferase involved in cell wall biosynthesis
MQQVLMNSPLVSIIIPNYNRAALIGQTIQSIRAQTYLNWEAIIVDDESSDNSLNIITGYCNADPRIKVIRRNRQPSGAPTCRNIGLEFAKGDYVIFLDSDDLLSYDCLERRMSFVQKHPNKDIYAFPAIRFKGDISNTSTLFYADDKHLGIIGAFILRPQWCVCGSLTNTKYLKSKGIRFEEGLTKWQDWQFHLEILLRGARFLRGYDEPDIYLRQHNDVNRINNLANKVNPQHATILILLKKVYSELISTNQFNDNEKEAFFCRCYELTAFLVNSGNYSLAKECVLFIQKVSANRNKAKILTLSFLVDLISKFPRIPKLKPLIYTLLIKDVDRCKKKMINNVANS